VSDKVEKKRIGILGGTFDPVHNAHLMIAEQARAAAHLHKVILMPAGTPPHKEERALTPARHRLAMARLAVEGRDGYEVSDLETASPGMDYTVDTLRMLNDRMPDAKLYFIVGGDSLMYLDQWREPEKLLFLASFIAIHRPGWSLQELERKRDELLKRFGGEVMLVACAGEDISSTEIRRRMALGLTISGLVPSNVEEYIREHRLYREEP
jgi:nicotinate-nucleotide adenylyltransferase